MYEQAILERWKHLTPVKTKTHNGGILSGSKEMTAVQQNLSTLLKKKKKMNSYMSSG